MIRLVGKERVRKAVTQKKSRHSHRLDEQETEARHAERQLARFLDANPRQVQTDVRQNSHDGPCGRAQYCRPENRAVGSQKPSLPDGGAAGRHRVLSGGQPLPAAVRRLHETFLGHDFSAVRVHSGDIADRSARSRGAEAYTVGNDVVFASGRYAPDTVGGQLLLAHELTHVIQQRALFGQTHEQVVQCKQQVFVNSINQKTGKQQRMPIIIGGLRLSATAGSDMLRYGALLSGPDQAHIGLYGDKLGYDPTHSDVQDPFRWQKLRDIIDSDEPVLIQKASLGDEIAVAELTPGGRQITKRRLIDLGLTLPKDSIAKKARTASVLPVTASPDANESCIYYTTQLGSPAESSMAHELFGHFWLALQGVPWVHPPEEDIARVKAEGTLRKEHGIRDPFGNVYTGTVRAFIGKYVGSSGFALNKSPTQNVSPALLEQALARFKQGFQTKATGSLNGDWGVPSAVGTEWSFVSNNYHLAPASDATSGETGRSTGDAPVAVTRGTIVQDLATWYGTLDSDRQYVFLRWLDDVRRQVLIRSDLASVLIGQLPRPEGMRPSVQQP